MKTKKSFYVMCLVVSLIITAGLNGCKSSPKSAVSGPVISNQVEHIVIDYQGAPVGAKIPDWVTSAVNSDQEAFTAMDRFQGKIPLVAYGFGQDLDMVRSWTNNFDMRAEISRRIKSSVEASFGGGQLGSKDKPENRRYVEDIVAVVSSTQFSSLAKEMDYWLKVREIDKSKKTQKDEYRYYVVFSMPETELQYQIDRAMGRISAATQEQQELKNDIRDHILRARWNSVQPSAN